MEASSRSIQAFSIEKQLKSNTLKCERMVSGPADRGVRLTPFLHDPAQHVLRRRCAMVLADFGKDPAPEHSPHVIERAGNRGISVASTKASRGDPSRLGAPPDWPHRAPSQ